MALANVRVFSISFIVCVCKVKLLCTTVWGEQNLHFESIVSPRRQVSNS